MTNEEAIIYMKEKFRPCVGGKWEEALDLAISTLERGGWISVEERLPEDFQKVLVFWWEHSEPMIDTAFWQKDAKHFDGQHWVRMEDKVTHWRPLPEPPKEDT